MGLGDHILCNGIVRYYAELYDRIYLFVKPHNLANVSYMYRDLSKIKFIPMNDAEVKFFMKVNPNNEYLIAGITQEWFHNFDIKKIYKTFDEGFYIAARVPFEDKWNRFYFQRDLEKEKNIFYNKLGLKNNEKFIIVHDDPKNNRFFKSQLIPSNIKIINPGDFKEIGIFDFLYTFEQAEELHLMNSSFMNLVDCILLKTKKLFLHSYARTDMGDNPNPQLKLNWNIMK
jgi:hypothetical protein